MNCQFQNDMSLAMGLYDLSPQTRRQCAETLSLRASKIGWEVWHIILVAPYVEDEEVHVALLDALRNCTEFPRISQPLIAYFSRIVKHPSSRVQKAYQDLLMDLGGEVFTSILTGYEDA